MILFGSRAKGTSRSNSDIDLAVDGLSGTLQIEALAVELDELSLPYKFHVKSVAEISNPALGACPRIDIFSEIEACIKNKHRHISDMTSIIF